ncbi:HD-GYP domain [Hahella chejuensis KCTC 2396]|uniref:HD-GYP domain n=1 Tax=Hahella chejuensis (strain KCTC 2396) TaxID=349521 RepID=Q2SQ88_HAHCH|nr:HD-GYP domain-containing protein [Hahella chejuensis]ABC27186.1 HD-GYP domain [Hahella chejuensis KCTC 2396]
MKHEIKTIELPCGKLEVGMFVSQLDRPWLDTPFPLQGFLLRTRRDIELLQQFCDYVYIDTVKGRKPKGGVSPLAVNIKDSLQRRRKLLPGVKLHNYVDVAPLEEEMPVAKALYKDFSANVAYLMDEMSRGASFQLKKFQALVAPMVESVIRNPDACALMARMKNQDSYAYKHSMSVSVWCVIMGRQLGLSQKDLEELAVGGLLLDVGKLQLPAELLMQARRLEDHEFELMKSHVARGLETVKNIEGVSRTILAMVENHHERHNGSGYPRGMAANAIPIYARIASLADCYDAITSQRPYAHPLPPSEAVRKLYEWRNVEFQAELVEEFIQAVGIYPAGTLVELTDGQVGIVIGEYRSRRLRPRLLMLLDCEKNLYDVPKELDLLDCLENSAGQPLHIERSLEPGSYDIDPETLYI